MYSISSQYERKQNTTNDIVYQKKKKWNESDINQAIQ